MLLELKVDDYAYQAGTLTGAIASIEGKLGKPVRKRQIPPSRCDQLGNPGQQKLHLFCLPTKLFRTSFC
jgi:hypothetical protein